MRTNDGGKAFPEIDTDQEGSNGDYYPRTYSYGGMSLRDWFAGQAMVGWLQSCAVINDKADAKVAQWAYSMADAMLAAREVTSHGA